MESAKTRMTRQTYDREAILKEVMFWLKSGQDPEVVRAKLVETYRMPKGTAYSFYREAQTRIKVGRSTT